MNLVVKNLPSSYNAHYLEMLFEKYGEVEYAKVVYDRVTKEPTGTGFVEFVKEEDGQKAIEAMNGLEFHGKELIVEKARPRRVNIWG
ncbi:RNA-binding protein [Bacteroidia bacterium]|jgi:RNA recognition motif-containing protein|nr:RNA-binding protein [Bacteroidota bacterium]MDB4174346.1 RNA-binding protein [Bacteroidia bacterium]